MRKMMTRSDPAPSRWAWRLQRIMLTPTYRFAMRCGVPFVLSAGLVFGYMASDSRRDAVIGAIAELRNRFETRPEFMVNLMAVEGASIQVQEDIREITQVDFPISSFDLDLEELRGNIVAIPAVADASIYVRKGGVLQVDIVERVPVALWRTPTGLGLVDIEGVVVGGAASRAARPELPLIAGQGAPAAVAEGMQVLAVAGPIGGRVRGLVRIGERRWDLVLDRDQRIMLPEKNPVQALERVIALHMAQDMLERDLAAVDMRLGERPTIRMNAGAVQAWWKIKDMVVEVERE